MGSEAAHRWPAKTLREVAADVRYGYTASATPDGAGPKFLRITDIVSPHIDWDTVPYCSIDAKDLEKHLLTDGDVVVARTGASAGASAYCASPIPAVFASYLVRFRIDRALANPRFVAYVLLSPAWWEYVAGNAGGSAQPQLNAKVMGAFPFPLPPLAEQERIASLLAALDDKIDGNRRLAAHLEELAATVFRARLVDFVGVEEFEGSESERMPSGWAAGSLADLARFVNGKAFTKYANGEGRPIIRIRELNGGVDDNTPCSNIAAADDYLARDDDILFAWSGSLGVYRWSGPEVLINQHIFKVLPDRWPAWFVYFWIEQHMADFRAIARDKATTMGHIQRRHLTEARVPLPDHAAMAEARGALDPVDQQRAGLVIETRTLRDLRDALLPKLVSGEIRIPDTADPAELIEPAAETLATAP